MSTPSNSAPTEEPSFSNRLALEKSPYLLQHAHNPVDWFPWGEDAFEAARTLDRPIFLSVGYSACHWCHVMERESFENPEIAALLNQEFISVKVDREERPDVDEVYMTAVQMTTGSGGWPMSVFLLPDGRPFYGGTYFPPESRQGQIGFPSLVTQLADAYRNRRSEVESVGDSIAEDLRKVSRQRPVADAGESVSPDALVVLAVEDMAGRFDAVNGGFGGAPKFPPHHALRLLTLAARNGNADAPRLLVTTLDKMALGGIYDHVGGGFHRYATDAIWLLPHFEKMLYDNALLARVYAEAFDLTGKVSYARVARETCDWVIRDLSDAAGGFYAALDADSEGEEGRYYVWTNDEARRVIEAEPAASDYLREYHVLAAGNYRDEATGRSTDANIPYLATGQSNAELPDVLSESTRFARAALLDARNVRVAPATDDKVITAWNGLMIGALAVCGSLLNEEAYTVAAKQAAEFCLTVLRTADGDLMRRYAKGEAGLPAFLDDYAFLGDGLLDLYDATGDEYYLSESKSLADVMLARFWDAEDSGFFYSGTGQEALIARTKDLFDGALPSANGVAARLLTRLGTLPGGDVYRERALAMLTAFNSVIVRAPQGTTTLIEAAFVASEKPSDTPTAAQSKPASVLALDVEGTDSLSLRAGEQALLTFVLKIALGYHVNARYPDNSDLIATTATLTTNVPATIGPIEYPAASTWSDGGESLSVFQGEVRFQITVTIASDAHPGTYNLSLQVRCQPCSDSVCLAPQDLSERITIVITA